MCFFIDASKAFDRVRHIDLFNVLSKRNMCALIQRLLMTMYSDQRIQVRWSNVLSEMFHMKRGCVVPKTFHCCFRWFI